MGRIRSLLLVTLILLVANIALAAERPTGFRGIAWLTDFSTVKDEMVHSSTDPSYGGIEFYMRKNDEMVIGGAKLEKIEYSFWQNQFYGVRILFSGYTNYSSLKGALIERFGSGHKPNRYIEEFYWFDFAEGNISIRYNDVQKTGVMRMSSKELAAKAQEYQKEKDKTGAKKGF